MQQLRDAGYLKQVDAAKAHYQRKALKKCAAELYPQPIQVDDQGRRYIAPYSKKTGKITEIAPKTPRPIEQIVTKDDKVSIRGKDHILKVGIAKIAAEYHLSNESTAMDLQEIGGDVLATVKVTVTAPDGRTTQRTASAAKSEGKSIQHLVATAETRAYGRAVLAAVGSGECSAEEMQSVDAGILDDRAERGRLIEEANASSPPISDYIFEEIPSKSDPTKSYLIQGTPGNLSCTCPDHQYRHRECKHIRSYTHQVETGRGQQRRDV